LSLEKAVQEKKVIKNGNRMKLGANNFQIWGFKKKVPAFYTSSLMFEQKPYKNSFKSCLQLPEKIFEEKMS
jgi:hypothetical protein